MKLALAMTAYNRPQYMREVLISLAKNRGYRQYKLHFSLEPPNKEVERVASSIKFMDTEIFINPELYGVRKNPYEMLKRVFAQGYDGVLYMEEDAKLAIDAIDLASWYFSLANANDYLCLNLYNHDSKKDAHPDTVIQGKKFSALGVGLTRHQWTTYFEPNWFAHKSGWDFSITDLIKNDLRVLQPEQSRSAHIGRMGGTYYRPHLHDKEYIHNYFYDKQRIRNFTIK